MVILPLPSFNHIYDMQETPVGPRRLALCDSGMKLEATGTVHDGSVYRPFVFTTLDPPHQPPNSALEQGYQMSRAKRSTNEVGRIPGDDGGGSLTGYMPICMCFVRDIPDRSVVGDRTHARYLVNQTNSTVGKISINASARVDDRQASEDTGHTHPFIHDPVFGCFLS